MNNLIVIGGNGVEAGKSTVARILQCFTANYTEKEILDVLTKKGDYVLLPFSDETSYQIKKFADKLKDIVCLMIGKDRHWLEENKNTKLGDDWKTDKIKYTPRLLMKHIGTTLFRDQLIPDIHVNMLFNEYNENSNWIIDDLRFRNEYDRVKKYNGVTIYVKRGEDEIDHVEGQLLESDFDYVIDNNGDISDLISKVKKVYDEIQVNYNRKKNY